MMKIAIVLFFAAGYCVARPAEPEFIEIVSENKETHPEGNYKYSFESSDGISQEQSAEVKIVEDVPILAITGQFSYTDAEGVVHSVKYTADENGFHPESEDIPVAPEIPAAIQEGLRYIEEHPTPPSQ